MIYDLWGKNYPYVLIEQSEKDTDSVRQPIAALVTNDNNFVVQVSMSNLFIK